MTRIGLLSDTHGSIPAKTFGFFKDCDQIWHAGDIGNVKVIDQLESFKPLVAVHGNIDGTEIRVSCPEILVFTIENVKVLMIHIGGYPGRYSQSAHTSIQKERPGLFISGHSHILKVMFHKKHQMLHIKLGAPGISGIQKVITMVRFGIDANKIQELEIFEKELRK